MTKRRLDEQVLARGLAPDLKTAQAQVLAGNVLVDEMCIATCGTLVPADAPIRLKKMPLLYVSRGGIKLAGALDALGLEVRGLRVLDAGASTGGFTDCLLQRGAAHVVAADVGRAQLAQKLRADARVTVVENCNLRHAQAGELGEPFDLVTADLSFISLRTVLPALATLVRPDGGMLLLVKPQFEAAKEQVGPGGIVRDEAVWQAAVDAVAATARTLGWMQQQVVPSPLPGADGNREFFLRLRR